MAYAGHQFGQFNPGLGDGRAIYLGELDLREGGSLDIQLKVPGVPVFPVPVMVVQHWGRYCVNTW